MPLLRRGLLMMAAILCSTACAKADVAQLIEQYQWQKRLIFVFAPSRDDAQLKQQLQLLSEADAALKSRDTLQWVVVYDAFVTLDATPRPQLGTRAFYKHFKAEPEQFTVLLIGKDGEEKLRSTTPLAAEEFNRVIDAMPMHKREASNTSQTQ
jgi:hypothetical protein